MTSTADERRGTCAECRHSNQGTLDALEGFRACPWAGATADASPCLIRFKDTGEYAFERFDGANCTWGTGDPVFRSAPAGYENRDVVFVGPDY
jgi:hypothetical protein